MTPLTFEELARRVVASFQLLWVLDSNESVSPVDFYLPDVMYWELKKIRLELERNAKQSIGQDIYR